MECATAVAGGRWRRSFQLIHHLMQRTSGAERDALDRVVRHFVDGLAARVVSQLGESHVTGQLLPQSSTITNTELQTAYLSLNRVTPFIRFAHLTANQAILEAFQGSHSVHIIDMNIMQGVQWPPLMQALAGREGGAPRIRISGVGSDWRILERTGNLLTTFAASLGLPMFEFHALHARYGRDLLDICSPSSLDIREGDALAINVSIPQHKLILQDQYSFVRLVRSLRPDIVTLSDRQMNRPDIHSLRDAFRHYRALFDSLEATVPPSSQDRINVEDVWLRGEIMQLFSDSSTIDYDGLQMMVGFPHLEWKRLLRLEGFQPIPHSAFAVSQARLLLRLHYPSEGYEIRGEDGDSLLMGWQDISLFGVSAWIV
ncbi:hypothetical protein KP509_14G029000 [Ceratopteris richardii]|nr:hypothetical protein KP509_14G029000 [Ceratopteris richardii]